MTKLSLFINNLIYIIDSIIILLYNSIYFMVIINMPFIDYNIL